MGGYIQNMLYASFGYFAYEIDPKAAALAVGFLLLVAAAQFFLISKKRRIAWVPLLGAAALLLPSALLY